MRTAKFSLEVAGYVLLFVISASAVLFLVGFLVFNLLTGFNVVVWVIAIPVLMIFSSVVTVLGERITALRRKR